MKALMGHIKPFEAPQKSVKIKIQVDFYFNTTFWNTSKVPIRPRENKSLEF